jgi:hypothetical protein
MLRSPGPHGACALSFTMLRKDPSMRMALAPTAVRIALGGVLTLVTGALGIVERRRMNRS